MPRSYAFELERFQEFLGTPNFIGLLLAPPNGTGAAPEVTDPAYSRKPVTLLPLGFLSASNAADIVWTGCPPSWPVVLYFQLYNLAGEPTYWGTLSRPLGAIAGAFTIPAGELVIAWVDNVNYADFGRLNPTVAPTTGDFTASIPVRWRMDAADAFVHDAMPHGSSVNLHAARTGPLAWTFALEQPGALTDNLPSPLGGPILHPAAGGSLHRTVTPGALDDVTDNLPAPESYLPNFAGAATLLRTNLVPAADIGIMKRQHMIDSTRGRTAGLTVAGPRALAF